MAVTLNTTAKVAFGDPAFLAGATALTVLLTWKSGASLTGDERLVSQWGGTPNSTCFLVHLSSANTKLGFILHTAAAGYKGRELTNPGIATSTQYRIGLRWRASDGAMEIWLDGVSQAVSTWIADSSISALDNSTYALEVGSETDESSNAADGDYAEFAVFTSYLSDADMIAHGKGFAPSLMHVLPRLYSRMRSVADLNDVIGALTGTNTSGTSAPHPRVIYPRRRPIVPPSVSASSFSGAGAVSTGSLSCAGSATFAPGTKTAAGVVALGAVVPAASAAFTKPTYAGTAALTLGPAVPAAAATFAPGTKTATGAVVLGAAVPAAAATFAPGTKTATGAVVLGPVVPAASATFAPGTKTAAGAVALGPVVPAGSATFTKPTYTSVAAVVLGPAVPAGTAIFATAVFSAAGVVTLGAAVPAAAGTFTKPTYTGTAALVLGPVVPAAAATFTKPTYTGTAALALGPVVLEAAATFFIATRTGVGTVTLGAAAPAASAAFTKPTWTGVGAVVLPAALMSGLAVNGEIPAISSAFPYSIRRIMDRHGVARVRTAHAVRRV